MPDDLLLLAAGQKLGGWLATRVTRGCERIPSDFDVTLTERYPGQIADIVIKPGDDCEVLIGADLVLTGYIDRYMPSVGPGEHVVRVQGRSKSQDLVDCSAGIDTQGRSTGMAVTATSLIQLAQGLAQPFGIDVTSLTGDMIPVSAPGGGPVQFNFVLTETPFELIERVARYAGVLVYDTPDGGIVCAPVGAGQMASGFEQGVNVQVATAAFSLDERYSIYQPSLMSADTFHDLGAGQFPYQPTRDEGVPRFRPLIVVSEQPFLGQPYAIKRAQWEAARRRGRSQSVRITCDSWRDRAGALWAPNNFATIDLPAWKLQPDDPWVISEVTFLRDQDRGTVADLLVMPREAFVPEPVVPMLYDWQIANALQGGSAR